MQAGWVAAASIYFSFLALYLNQERSISLTVAGAIILTSGLAAAVFQVVGGILADKFGHRRMLLAFALLGSGVYAVFTLILALGLPTWTVVALAIATPTVTSMTFPVMSAIIANTSTEKKLTQSYSMLAIGSNIGWAVGPMAGGYLFSVRSFAWLAGAATIVYALSLLGILFLPEEQTRAKAQTLSPQSFGSVLGNPALIIFTGLCTVWFLDMGQWGNTLSVFTVDRVGFTTVQYGVLMMISGLLIIVFQYPIGQRIERFGLRKALIVGSILFGAGFLSLTWMTNFISGLGSIIVISAGEMLFVPTALAVVGKMSRAEDLGKNMGFYGLAATLGDSIGPLMGGALLDAFPRSAFWVWGPIGLAGLLAALGFTVWRGYLKTSA